MALIPAYQMKEENTFNFGISSLMRIFNFVNIGLFSELFVNNGCFFKIVDLNVRIVAFI